MGSKPWTNPFFLEVFGGGKRDRTADLLHAMQALSQLSYTPDEAEYYSALPRKLQLPSSP